MYKIGFFFLNPTEKFMGTIILDINDFKLYVNIHYVRKTRINWSKLGYIGQRLIISATKSDLFVYKSVYFSSINSQYANTSSLVPLLML